MGACVFCDIAAGRAPAEKIYEDERVVSFMDIRPLVPGHALVIPKAHGTDLRDVGAEDLGPILAAAKKVAPALMEAVGADGFNLIAANGVSAGQEVFHFHLHVMPRRPKDAFTATSLRDHVKGAKVVAHEELRPVADRAREALTARTNR